MIEELFGSDLSSKGKIVAMLIRSYCIAIIIGSLVVSGGCSTVTPRYYVDAPTGRYAIVERSCKEVQEAWEYHGGDPRMVVEAITIVHPEGGGTIIYCTLEGLDEEIDNVAYERSLKRAELYDRHTIENPGMIPETHERRM